MSAIHYNDDLERTILGLFLQDGKLFKTYGHTITEGDFFSPRHQLLFTAIRLLDEKGYAIDFILLSNLLEAKGKLSQLGGRSYLTSLFSTYSVSIRLPDYIKELKKLAKTRKELSLTFQLHEAIEQGNDISILRLKEELIDIEKDFASITPAQIATWLPAFEKNYHNKQEGIMTPFPSINRATGGFKKGELVSLTGLSGSGKSLLALQFALEAVKKNFKTIYFSLEMSPNQMIPRFLSMTLGLEINKIKYKEVNYEVDIKNRIVTLADYPINFVFEMVDTAQIYSIAYVEKIRSGLDFIIVDYFSLIQDKGWKSEIEKEKEVINRLKNISKKLDIVVLVPNALSKDVAKRKKGEAKAEDTIGSIHQTYTVDIALALNRQRTANDGRFSIVKNRDGEYCSFDIAFDKKHLTFSEVDTTFSVEEEEMIAMTKEEIQGF